MYIGSFLYSIDDTLEEVLDWQKYIRDNILPESIIWEEYTNAHQPLPPITELFFATEWTLKEGPTRLPRKVSTGCSVQPLLSFFSGKPKCLWVVISFEYTENEENSSSESAAGIKQNANHKLEQGKKRAKAVKAEKIKVEPVQVCFFFYILLIDIDSTD